MSSVQHQSDLEASMNELRGDFRVAPDASPLRVFMRHIWNSENSYPGMLAEAVQAQGVEVAGFGDWLSTLPRGRGVLLYHWPDRFFLARSFKERRETLVLLLGLWAGKLLWRQKVVWVVHNLQPHDRRSRRFKLAQAIFLATVDGLVFLSPSSRDAFLALYPQLQRRPRLVTTHGHYRPRESEPPSLPRALRRRAVRLAFTGRVMRYKGPDMLARVVKETPGARLVIAGRCRDPELQMELVRMAAESSSIELRLARMSEPELEAVLDGSDAVVLPYRDILNSGSALLALSRWRPVIAPRLGSLVDLQAQVGEAWLWLYDGPFGPDTLDSALTWLRETKRTSPPDLSAHDWPVIGGQVVGFLNRLANGPNTADDHSSYAQQPGSAGG